MFKFPKHIYLCLQILILLVAQCIWSQSKNEKERRIQFETFPQNAQTLINTFPEKVKRIRYYKEIDGDKESYETKFKYKNHWYSVEFDSVGLLEDVEILIKKRQFPDVVIARIKSYVEQQASKFDFIKIQEQYPYHKNSSETLFLNSIFENRTTIASNYEIIIALKIKRQWQLQEITFDTKGKFLKSRNLQPDSYEYIMY